MRTLFISGVLVCTALVSPSFAQTQITSGVIQGVVTDTSGAVVPGVTVEARNLGTNLSRTLVTEGDGRFVFLQLPSGTYTVTYSLPGFATLVQEDIGLTVGQAVTLAATMRVSGLAETVRVTTSAPVVETTRTAVASTLNQMTVESSPILGRKFEDLLTLTPGVSIVQGADGDEITFAGQRGDILASPADHPRHPAAACASAPAHAPCNGPDSAITPPAQVRRRLPDPVILVLHTSTSCSHAPRGGRDRAVYRARRTPDHRSWGAQLRRRTAASKQQENDAGVHRAAAPALAQLEIDR